MLDKGTYGNTPAAHRLVEIINENNLNIKGLGLKLIMFNRILNELCKIDIGISMNLAKDQYYKICKSTDKYPELIRTYVVNILTTSYRVWLSEQIERQNIILHKSFLHKSEKAMNRKLARKAK